MNEFYNYDITDNDPYTIGDGTCLINHLGLTDMKSLNEAEAEVSVLTMAALEAEPVQCTWDLSHLQMIHSRIFSEVYPFAGIIRQVEIAKGGEMFMPYRLIERESEAIFDELCNESVLRGLPIDCFASRAGYFMGRINAIHPFREGNGRAQRVMLDQMAAQNNFSMQWGAISGLSMIEACVEARNGDRSAPKLVKLFRLNLVEAG